MNTLILTFLLAIYLPILALAEVLHLSEHEFASQVDGSHAMLVEFYAPWCGHCKNLEPEYKIVGDTFQPSDGVKIIAIDATQAPKLSEEYGIKGYPTLKFFPKGSVTPEDFNGGRTADSIIKWINEKVGTSRKLKTAPSSVVTLTTENFDALVLGDKAALVEFYAPWCGHCKSLAPKYEQLGNVFAGEKGVVIGKVDATEYGELANKYDVSGYPTLKFFPAGSAEPIDYNENRELEDLVQFVNTNANTQRKSDGSLLSTAGRLETLDSLITGVQIDDAVVASLKKAAADLPASAKASSKHYIAIAEKIVAKGASYVTGELNRLAGMIGNPSVTPDSKTNFMIKQNILNAFL